MRDPEWLEADKKFMRNTFELIRGLNVDDRITTSSRAYKLLHICLKRSHKYIDQLREYLAYMIRHAKCDGLADAFGIADACEILDSVEPPEVK